MTKIATQRPAVSAASTQQARGRAEAKTPAQTAPTGWKPSVASPAAQAKALAAFLKSPEGAKAGAKLVDTVAKKNDLARALNWEAGHIKSVKPYESGKFLVDVQLDVLKGKGVEKNFFTAIVDGKGKVLDVPQG